MAKSERILLGGAELVGETLIGTSPVGLPLSEWLTFSWFFPEGFNREKSIETESAFIVYGETQTFKFPKIPTNSWLSVVGAEQAPRSAFNILWRLACEEIDDHSELAPGVYQGLLPFTLEPDGPVWLSTQPVTMPDKMSPPQSATGVAIVMKRLPETASLANLLEFSEPLAERTLFQIAKVLKNFHHSERHLGSKEFLLDPEGTISNHFQQRFCERLKKFISTDGNFLDPFSRLILLETNSYLVSFFEKHADLMFSRGEEGFVVPGHGALSLENVCLTQFGEAREGAAILGRTARNSSLRKVDVLSDLAALTSECHVRGFVEEAQGIERFYFAENGDAFNAELYRFFLVVSALERAQEIISGARESEIPPGQYLSYALRKSLGIEEPFVIFIAGQDNPGKSALVQGLVELSLATPISPELVRSSVPDFGEPEEMKLSRMFSRAAAVVEFGKACVFDWSFIREEERLLLIRFMNDLAVPWIVAWHDSSTGGTFSNRSNEILHTQNLDNLNGKLFHIDSFLGPPESALLLLRELARRSRS